MAMLPVRSGMPPNSDDESQLLGDDTDLDILTDTEPLARKHAQPSRGATPWRVLLGADALGLIFCALIAHATDATRPISLGGWLAVTAVTVLLFALLGLMPLSKLVYHLHLHGWGFVYCMLIHAGLQVRKGEDIVHRYEDTLINWVFLVFATPLCYVFGAAVTLREQPGLEWAALVPPGRAPAVQALMGTAAGPMSGAESRHALAAHTQNFCYYFVPFVVGMLPNFLAKAGLLPDFSLSLKSMATWGLPHYAAVLVCAAMLVHLFGYHAWRARRAGVLRVAGLFYGATLLGLALTAAAARPTHAMHLHHYFTAALLVPLTRFPERTSAVWQGMLVGFHLQGVAVFGIEPLYDALAGAQIHARLAAPPG